MLHLHLLLYVAQWMITFDPNGRQYYKPTPATKYSGSVIFPKPLCWKGETDAILPSLSESFSNG